jgi:hypothetical protein
MKDLLAQKWQMKIKFQIVKMFINWLDFCKNYNYKLLMQLALYCLYFFLLYLQ